MAQGQAVLADPPGIDATANLSEKDLGDIQQYDRIVRFRDAVLSGEHPTVKPSPGLLTTARSSSHGNKSHHSSEPMIWSQLPPPTRPSPFYRSRRTFDFSP